MYVGGDRYYLEEFSNTFHSNYKWRLVRIMVGSNEIVLIRGKNKTLEGAKLFAEKYAVKIMNKRMIEIKKEMKLIKESLRRIK